MSAKKKKLSWTLKGALAFGGWLIILWVAGLALPEDGSFPWWYTALMLPIYPAAALSAFLLPDDSAGLMLPFLMMLITLATGAGFGWVVGKVADRKHSRKG